jgi:nitroimidazol reductase NimA-like FMN-containing flavoprotein (pyridoxamine 5'-phosphate oxidase superfamily)
MGGMQAMSGSIVDLGREDSLALLASAPVGRIVFTRGALPAIHPVNFVVEGDDVVITTSEDSALLSAVAESIVAFEADEIDAANHVGWSVVVTGRARLVTDRQNIERLRVIMRTSTGPAESARFIRIRPEIVSGRRISTTL